MINRDTLNSIKEYATKEPRSITDDKIIELIDTIEALVPIAKLGISALREVWDKMELDYEDLQTEATRLCVVKQVEFNSEVHGEHEYAEDGDPWFEFNNPDVVNELSKGNWE